MDGRMAERGVKEGRKNGREKSCKGRKEGRKDSKQGRKERGWNDGTIASNKRKKEKMTDGRMPEVGISKGRQEGRKE